MKTDWLVVKVSGYAELDRFGYKCYIDFDTEEEAIRFIENEYQYEIKVKKAKGKKLKNKWETRSEERSTIWILLKLTASLDGN